MWGIGAYPNWARSIFNWSLAMQTRHAFADLRIDPAVGADKAAQVVLFDDLVMEEIQGEFHVLITCHGGVVVEVFNVERHKPGVSGIDGAVEKTLHGGEAGAVGGGGARVVEYIANGGDTDTVNLGLVQADGGNHAGIGDLAVGGDAGFGHVEDSVGATRHASDDALGEAADIIGQAGAPGRLVGALEKMAKIQGFTGNLIDHSIGLFLGEEKMGSIFIA